MWALYSTVYSILRVYCGGVLGYLNFIRIRTLNSIPDGEKWCRGSKFLTLFFLIDFRSNDSIIYQTMDATWMQPDPDIETTSEVTSNITSEISSDNASEILEITSEMPMQ
jgi:hypothetical protein